MNRHCSASPPSATCRLPPEIQTGTMSSTEVTQPLKGCDTFVVLPPASQDCIVFGKNSDRPSKEIQEVVYFPAKNFDGCNDLQCTYIEIPQVAHTQAVILSRPSWMWGAEMGANDFGVCIGNEAVWTKLTNEKYLIKEKLLGMDLVRLGLERGKTAEEALDVIIKLMEQYGQGGLCSEDGMTYHNSFLISDRKEAWVLETAGEIWAAEKITEGIRNISNELTIRKKFDRHHKDIHSFAEEKGWWKKEDGDLDFALVFTAGALEQGERLTEGKRLLEKFSEDRNFNVLNMMEVLRNKESGICMGEGGFCSTGSQVSLVATTSSPLTTNQPACHWFTATPDPSLSLYKPFVFTKDSKIGDHTISPDFGLDDPRLLTPRFSKVVDRSHRLWAAHQAVKGPAHDAMQGILRDMEANCVKDMEDLMRQWKEADDSRRLTASSSTMATMGSTNMKKMAEIFMHMVDIEMNFYKTC